MPYRVVASDGSVREVRGLGWLLRHRHEVTQLNVFPTPEGGAVLVAHLADVRTFYCDFASRAVLRDWINKRRAWRGLPVMWSTDGHVHMVSVPIPEHFGG